MMASPPVGPGQVIGEAAGRFEDEPVEQAVDLVAGQGDQPWLWWVLGAFGGGDDGE